MYFAQKKAILTVPVFQPDFTSQGLKKNRCVSYNPYATLVILLPVLGVELFQFLCKVVFNGFCSNWFKLVLAHPPNSQNFNQKKIFFFFYHKIFGFDISSFYDMIVCTALKDTQR